MTTRPAGDPDRLVDCSIRVRGRLEPRWAAWFAGMTLTAHDDGTTTLRGPLPDQAALHGVLAGLRDLGVPLLSVSTTPGADLPAATTPDAGSPAPAS